MRVAVVGTGISGLGAAWLLSRRHEVHVFERRSRFGGHTHTLQLDHAGVRTSAANRAARGRGPSRTDQRGLRLDTGFLVYNEPTYPLLTRLFDELGVATQPSDMSWSLRCERCDLEYAGDPRGIVAQPRRLADPTYLRMVADILRFNRLGRRFRHDPRSDATTIGRFLDAAGFADGFRRHYLLPMTAAIWSTGTGPVRDFPLGTLLRFLDNHGLLGVTTHHPWRTVTGGTASYVPRLLAPVGDRAHLDRGVVAIERDDDGVRITTTGGAEWFDAVVVATHADQALDLLVDADPLEKDLLGPWTYTDNDVWVHTDPRLLPSRPAARASWNYLLDDCRLPDDRPSLSYLLNRLQGLDRPEPYVVTLNPSSPPDDGRVLTRLRYRHPAYTRASVATQPELDRLNGRRRTFFAGAYQRNGFHEDGLWSAVRVAAHLGVEWP